MTSHLVFIFVYYFTTCGKLIREDSKESFGGDLLMSLNFHLLLGKRLCGQWRQVVWGSGRLGCLTKLCLRNGSGVLGRRSHVYGGRL